MRLWKEQHCPTLVSAMETRLRGLREQHGLILLTNHPSPPLTLSKAAEQLSVGFNFSICQQNSQVPHISSFHEIGCI